VEILTDTLSECSKANGGLHQEIDYLTETLAELWATSRKHAPDMAEDELAAFTRAGKLLAAKFKEKNT
jgi:hypothetical protein